MSGTKKNMIQLTPPMGWNSWNTFGPRVNEQVIIDTVDRIIELGLDKCGYEYVVIDDCWSLHERDENGRLVPDPEKFPHGMKWLSDYVHSRGLKFGMYSCCGAVTCAGYPSSYEHEFVDAATFAEWGVDYLKYDNCFASAATPTHMRYKRMGIALANCGRDILYSACSWGSDDTRVWIKETGAHSWRSTGDINDSFESVRSLITQEIKTMEYNGQGCFNDLDMLIVGMKGSGNVANGGCSFDEYLLHFAFWCMFGSTLMIGADLSTISDEDLSILKNPDLIRIDQDKACRQPFFISRPPKKDPRPDAPYFYADYPEDVVVLARYLDDGTIAIGFFNLMDSPISRWNAFFLTETLGVPESTGKTLMMRDIFTGKEEKITNGIYYTDCKPHACRMFIARVVDK